MNESDRGVVLTVQRTGGSEGTVAVSYATRNFGATAPGDYEARSGVLTFGPGVTSQTIVVPIVADLEVEGSETFLVALTNPTGGAVLATERPAIVTIAAHATPAPIPTLSTWLLILLALALAAMTLLRMR